MKRSLLGLATGVLAALSMLGESSRHPFGNTPIAVLIAADPWVGGSEEPKFVLYSDGTVIWRSGDAGPNGYRTTTLGGDEFERLSRDLTPTASFMDLKPVYDLVPNVTDQAAVQIYLFQGAREKAVTVVGLEPKGRGSAAFAILPTDHPRDSLPAEFKRMYDLMSGFHPQRAADWKAEYLQVRIWPFDHAKLPPLPWPATWPDLNDARTEKHDEMYYLYLSADLEGDLKRFLARRGATRPALINGRKWSVMYRYVLPGMAAWEKALQNPQTSK